SSWRAVRSPTSKRPSETRPVACIMSAIERVSPRTKGSQQRTEIITTAAAIPSHGLISKKKGLVKKAGEMNMSTLRRGSSSGVAMSGIRTPTQYFILERVKTRKGGPTGPGGGFRCDIGPLRRTGGGNGAPLAGGGGPKRSIRASTSAGSKVRGPASCSPVFRYKSNVRPYLSEYRFRTSFHRVASAFTKSAVTRVVRDAILARAPAIRNESNSGWSWARRNRTN